MSDDYEAALAMSSLVQRDGKEVPDSNTHLPCGFTQEIQGGHLKCPPQITLASKEVKDKM